MVGGSLGLSYSDLPGDHEMFAHTLRSRRVSHVRRDRHVREGTMFALVLQGAADRVLPARRGQFANDVQGVEMAVKDKAHVPEGWAYCAFGGMGTIAATAKAMPKNACCKCHAEHAARDHVFLQFCRCCRTRRPTPKVGRTQRAGHPLS